MPRQAIPESDACVIGPEFDVEPAQGRIVLREMQDDAPVRIPDLAAFPERIVPHRVPGRSFGPRQRKIVKPAVQAGYGPLSGRHLPDVVVHGQVQGRRKHHGTAVQGRCIRNPGATVHGRHADACGLTAIRGGDVEGLRPQDGGHAAQGEYPDDSFHLRLYWDGRTPKSSLKYFVKYLGVLNPTISATSETVRLGSAVRIWAARLSRIVRMNSEGVIP